MTKHLGRFEILAQLATGGMARVFLARQTGIGSFQRHVVLKTILPERANDPRFVERFLEEARVAATLHHQHIAQVYEVDQCDGTYYMALEYVRGQNCASIIERAKRRMRRIPIELAVSIARAIAAGLHHAHERRDRHGQLLAIVHRDVSPGNIMVGYDGSVKLLDFGIAQSKDHAPQSDLRTIEGTPGYMSPEMCHGKPIDRRADVFGLGVCLYEMTTMRRAFRGTTDADTMRRIVEHDLVPPSSLVAGYPRELEAIVLRALANDPALRFQSAEQLAEALDRFAPGGRAVAAGALGGLLVDLFANMPAPELGDATGDDLYEIDDDDVDTIELERPQLHTKRELPSPYDTGPTRVAVRCRR